MRDVSPVVHVATLGCARNDADSELLAGRLTAAGFTLTADSADAEILLVNTCGFIEAARKDSIDALLEAVDRTSGTSTRVIAVGCLAERYADELAQAMPEIGVLGFRDYDDIATRLRAVLGGRPPAPVAPQSSGAAPWRRARLDAGPYAPLKIASGCDRRCAFCAIPSIRGPLRSRPTDDIVAEARWLVENGVREVMLVSENTSAYGKDLGTPLALETLLHRLSEVDGLDWVRVSYLQPAEVRPGLLDVMATVPHVVPYFDLSFQHASGPLLRRMRRFGDAESFLGLLRQVRDRVPLAGVRSSFIVGFPGETDDDLATLHEFIQQAGLDAIGLFAFSSEEGTEAHVMDHHLPPDVIAARFSDTLDMVTWLTEARAEQRVGETVDVLVESTDDGFTGRAAHQGPEVDGVTTLLLEPDSAPPAVGDMIRARVTDTDGIDLIAVPA